MFPANSVTRKKKIFFGSTPKNAWDFTPGVLGWLEAASKQPGTPGVKSHTFFWVEPEIGFFHIYSYGGQHPS